MTNNISPLRYPGGKTRACDYLNKIIKDNYDINKYKKVISPFYGGGSFEFYLQNTYNLKIIANDKFTPLYNFWQICKSNKIQLINKLSNSLNTITKTIFTDYRNQIMKETDNINQAYMYFVINRCSFSGATLSGGFSLESSKKRFTLSSINRIESLDLNNFEIYNEDYETFIEKYKNEQDNILFLDPPYYLGNKSNLYGKNGDLHESFDHMRLFNCISKRKDWIMTYNDCEYIRELYKKYKIIEVNWSYGMNKSKKSSEIVIIN